ncbi:hypothetical protein Glove_227g90 [Diversispora epigaea]|uniref:Uncharacterized protein n=1 Tax=Diversispora epigaea TaxID=1348612 RepID=A0A397IDZ6_9GLOM|nr:hypothetical protein Glove_227g90 [Diversispora epigaea]
MNRNKSIHQRLTIAIISLTFLIIIFFTIPSNDDDKGNDIKPKEKTINISLNDVISSPPIIERIKLQNQIQIQNQNMIIHSPNKFFNYLVNCFGNFIYPKDKKRIYRIVILPEEVLTTLSDSSSSSKLLDDSSANLLDSLNLSELSELSKRTPINKIYTRDEKFIIKVYRIKPNKKTLVKNLAKKLKRWILSYIYDNIYEIYEIDIILCIF